MRLLLPILLLLLLLAAVLALCAAVFFVLSPRDVLYVGSKCPNCSDLGEGRHASLLVVDVDRTDPPKHVRSVPTLVASDGRIFSGRDSVEGYLASLEK